MTQHEILTEIQRLTPAQQLALAEAVLRQVREELQPAFTLEGEDQRLILAAEAARADYLTDKELIAFTVLDGEDFHA